MAVKPSFSLLRISILGMLALSCAIFAATQCYAQDVADAARQQQGSRENKQKKSKHVYTEEDLKHAQILTPEDRAQVAAKKNLEAPVTAEKNQDAVDAKEISPNAPLGNVARRFRKQKQSQKLQQSAEFHLPAAAPALASPKPPLMPLQPRLSNPVAPRFAPVRPPVKRSPFERPRTFVSAPPRVSASHTPAVPVTPSQPTAPAPVASQLNVVTVKPGDSLWKLAQQNLGNGLRWRDLLAVNPGIADSNNIAVGSQIYLPATASALRAATKFVVRQGDTLTKIAQTQLGNASFWACIARANPAVHDANLILEGQQILVPADCKP